MASIASSTGSGPWSLDPHGREPGDPDAGALPAGETEADARATLRSAAHRTLRDVTADYESFRFNTMVAKLMELANTLFRYRGTAVAGSAEWDEAIRLLLLMLAPAAPHISEELWSRRLAAAGAAVGLDPHGVLARGRPERRRRVDPRDPGPGERQAARQGRRRRGRLARRDRGGGPRHASGSAPILDGRTPDRIVVAGGGKLVNLVIR